MSDYDTKKPANSRWNACSRCFCLGLEKTESTTSINSKVEPCEYVVEKLVIKRVPIKDFATESDMKMFSLNTKESKEPKSIVTFNSYCQMTPKRPESPCHSERLLKTVQMGECFEETPVCLEEPNLIAKASPTVTNPSRFHPINEAKEEMTTGRRIQLQKCVQKNWTVAAQVHKMPSSPLTAKRTPVATTCNLNSSNNVLYAKQKVSRENSPVTPQHVDPAVKETLDMLAVKKSPHISRRRVHRDPETGDIMDIFQNSKEEKPINLDEILIENERMQSEAQYGDGASLNQNTPSQAGLKWKIIIKPRDSREEKNKGNSREEEEYVSDFFIN